MKGLIETVTTFGDELRRTVFDPIFNCSSGFSLSVEHSGALFSSWNLLQLSQRILMVYSFSVLQVVAKVVKEPEFSASTPPPDL